MKEDSQKIHEEMMHWARKEFKGILEGSEQAIYIYFCDRHKICNKKFSSMLGYSSPEEWEMKEDVLSDAKEEHQDMIVSAYRNAMEKKISSLINVSWKNKKTGKLLNTRVIFVPSSYKDELFAIHFITVL